MQSEVVKAAKFVPPAWKCGNASMEPPTKRHLLEENHAALDHSHHHEHEHSTTDGIDISEIKNELRNSNLRLGKRRELQTATGYKFQVDMYIEIDFDLCARHGETCTNGVGPKTLNYINVLFAGANTVYEVRRLNYYPTNVVKFLFAIQVLNLLFRPYSCIPTEGNRYPPQRASCCR